MIFDEETLEHWNQLLAAALQNKEDSGEVERPSLSLGVPSRKEESQIGSPELRPLAESQALGGGLDSILTRVIPSGGASWLKWINPIAGLLSLFSRRGDTDEPAQLPIFAPRLPARSVEYGLGQAEGEIVKVADRDEEGRLRLAESGPRAASQVVVQVQAMDSRSFLDNREEIASAVRQALMESHGLGTVLREFQG